uniref:Uncharacterized protein n=1 Tax=Octopus bimaculoides TaxID=37653 RepID=A0A0L8GRM8_OCTBM
MLLLSMTRKCHSYFTPNYCFYHQNLLHVSQDLHKYCGIKFNSLNHIFLRYVMYTKYHKKHLRCWMSC